MGLLVDGTWHDRWYETDKTGGKFERSESAFKNWITRDGSAGPSGNSGFAAEAGRYHLYVSYACPWAHRTLILRALKGLEEIISISVVHWRMKENGWTFDEAPGVIADPILKADYLHELYTEAVADYSGRVTVPLLWDKSSGQIVSNESADIVRMFNSAFNEIGATATDYYPDAHRTTINELNSVIYDTVNNGVYKAGFATSQAAYEAAVTALFETLDMLEVRLEGQHYLCGDTLTEVDLRLLPTLLRFDLVYVGHFKCNVRRIADYPNLYRYMKTLYAMPAIRDTCNFEHAKRHYYESHETINPTGIVPVGPAFDFIDLNPPENGFS